MIRPGVRRLLVFLGGDGLLIVLALLLAFVLRFEGHIPPEYHRRMALFVALALAAKIPMLHRFGLYSMSWTYMGLYELLNVFRAVTIGSLVWGAVLLIALRETPIGSGVPRSVLVIDYTLTLILIGAFRSSKRIYMARRRTTTGEPVRRLLIVGAGSAGEMLLRELRRNPALRYEAVGIVDDDPVKAGISLHGVRVIGRREDIPQLTQSEAVDEIVIAMPSVPVKTIADIVSICKRTRAAVKILPAIYRSLIGEVRIGYVREIRIEDLLPRRPVRIDVAAVAASIRGETVLVTGAGGSIGSELCRQIAPLEPRRLILAGMAENDIFEIDAELRQLDVQVDVVPLIVDVRNAAKVRHIFRTFSPTIVFHTAAHKHVSLMELNPDEAVSNNILGTKVVAEACHAYGVPRMVVISTDKAVNSTGVMGASKRCAELVVQALVPRSRTKFMIVRFGNVLNSTGSVVPIFRKQIAQGGPVTITDPAMTRYFMTIPEAVHLIIQAAAMGEGGEVFVLDMGEPVRILDLAENLIRLSGLEPYRDIDIRVIGQRQGEKVHEETFFAGEVVERTRHDQIFVAKIGDTPDYDWLCTKLDELLRETAEMNLDMIRKRLGEIIRPRNP